MTAHQRATDALARAASARIAATAVRDNAVQARDAAASRLERAAAAANGLYAGLDATRQTRRAAQVHDQAVAELQDAEASLASAVAAEAEAAEAAEAVGLQDIETDGPFAVARVHTCWIGTGVTGSDRCDRCKAGALRKVRP